MRNFVFAVVGSLILLVIVVGAVNLENKNNVKETFDGAVVSNGLECADIGRYFLYYLNLK